MSPLVFCLCSALSLTCDEGTLHETEVGTFVSNEVTIQYYVSGPPNGIPVILLHGWFGNGQGFFDMEFAKQLIQDGYRVISLDQRGHGESDKPHDRDQYGTEMVADVANLMEHLGIGRAHIIGYSMGGIIATKLMVDKPTLVASAIIGGGGGYLAGGFDSFTAAYAESVESGKSAGDALIENYALTGSPPMTNAQREFFLTLNNGTDAKAYAAAALSWSMLARTRDELRAIDVPSLVIIGEHENEAATESAREFHELVRNSQFVVVPGAFHETVLTSEEFTANVRQFIKENSDTGDWNVSCRVRRCKRANQDRAVWRCWHQRRSRRCFLMAPCLHRRVR